MQADPATLAAALEIASVAPGTAAPAPLTPFVPAGGALLLPFAAGLLLWAIGGRLLRPGLALAGMVAGLPIGIWLGDRLAPEVPPVLFAAGGALAGLVIAALCYRLAIASATALLAGVLALLGAWTAANLGLISDLRAAERIDALTDAARGAGDLAAGSASEAFDALVTESAGPIAAPLARETLTRLWLSMRPPAANAGAGGTTVGLATGASSDDADTEAAASDGAIARTREAIIAIHDSMPSPLRTLLLAALAAGACAGALFGFLFADAAAQIVTSIAGSFLILIAGVPLLSALLGRGDDLLPLRPDAWLAAVAILAIIGYGVQRLMTPPHGERRTASPAA